MIRDETLPLDKIKSTRVRIDVFSLLLERISRELVTDLVGAGWIYRKSIRKSFMWVVLLQESAMLYSERTKGKKEGCGDRSSVSLYNQQAEGRKIQDSDRDQAD